MEELTYFKDDLLQMKIMNETNLIWENFNQKIKAILEAKNLSS